MLLLFETAAGFALLKVLKEGVLKEAAEVRAAAPRGPPAPRRGRLIIRCCVWAWGFCAAPRGAAPAPPAGAKAAACSRAGRGRAR